MIKWKIIIFRSNNAPPGPYSQCARYYSDIILHTNQLIFFLNNIFYAILLSPIEQ